MDPVVKARTESSVTLGWSPPPHGDRPVIIEGYLVERRRLGTYTWSRCHEAEWVATPELTVTGVAEEGDFQFRVLAVNSFGQGPCLDFPETVHLGMWGSSQGRGAVETLGPGLLDTRGACILAAMYPLVVTLSTS